MVEKQKVEKKNRIENMGESNCEFITFSYFPKDKWKEYDADVKENYGDIRWVKAWHDHLIAKQKTKEDFMLDLIIGLKHEIQVIKQEFSSEKQNLPKVVKTLGGEMKEE